MVNFRLGNTFSSTLNSRNPNILPSYGGKFTSRKIQRIWIQSHEHLIEIENELSLVTNPKGL